MNEIINQLHDLSIFDLWQLYYLIGFENDIDYMITNHESE